MQAAPENIILLLYRSISGGDLEEDESAVLQGWLAASPHHRELLNELMDEPRMEQELRLLMAINEDAALRKLQEKMARGRNKQLFHRPWVKFAAAVAMIILLSLSIYSLLRAPAQGH